MTRRERLTATLAGQPVDRPAVSFYEIGGWNILASCDDPDEFNVYNGPSWRPLAELAEQETDLIRMQVAIWKGQADGSAACIGQADRGIGQWTYETSREGRSRFTRTRLKLHDRELTGLSRRDADTMTTWTIEHLLKSADDLVAYLQLPAEEWTGELDVEAMEAVERELGEAGIVMVDVGDPICHAADLFSMADYTVVAMTEPKLFHQLLERLAEGIYARTRVIAEQFPGRLWRICGSEYASEPYLPPRLYREYVTRYTGPMVEMIQAHGGIARIHSHGRLKGILPHIVEMGARGLDPCEPPPQGDMTLTEIRRTVGEDMVLFGNIESSDIENLAPTTFREKVSRALEEGTAGGGRGFVLMPSSCPYGRTILPNVLANYQAMVDMAKSWSG